MENESTYEMECMRAELLGQSLPDKEEFEKKLTEHMKTQKNDLEIEESKILEEEDENINRTHGKLDELNNILSATQKKLNNFKKTACGSLSNIFRKQSTDKVEDSENIEGVQGLQNIEGLERNEIISDSDENNISNINLKAAKNESLDINKKLNSHLDKLDSLINKAENAELAMASQTKQMKKFTK